MMQTMHEITVAPIPYVSKFQIDDMRGEQTVPAFSILWWVRQPGMIRHQEVRVCQLVHGHLKRVIGED